MSIPLNPAQKQAVEHINGPMLVLAGAGSGKTRVITQRIARLIERGVPPTAIVALTFTNKAAGEMGERVATLLKGTGQTGAAKGLTIATFHAFGLEVLKKERGRGTSVFTIFDQGDCIATIKEILAQVTAGGDKRFDAGAVMARISNAKNAFLAPEEFVPKDGDLYDEVTKEVYPRYVDALRAYRAYDFDDLVCEVARMWSTREDVLARWRARYRHVLVDEYQDTNRAQMVLLRLLAGEHQNLCVVGDDDQAIYGWRGADVKNILAFDEHFPGAVIVKLEQNYRSRAPVLAVANAVIAKRTDAKHKKVLFTDRAGGSIVKAAVASTPEAEAAYVAREVKRWIREEKKAPRDVAVLYRSNGQAKLIEEALREHGVAYRVVGGQQFFERKEVKDLLAFFKLALHRTDEISLRRIMNVPPRGIGTTSVERLAQHALAKGWTLWEAIERVDALDGLPAGARDGCKALEKIVGDMRKKLLAQREKPSVVARELLGTIGLQKELERTSPSPQAAARRWSNLEAIVGTFARRENRELANGGANALAKHEESLAAFLHALTLNTSEEEDPENVVTLSTLHGSKGLEFDVVHLIGCEEGLLPHTRTTETRATDVALGGPGLASAGPNQGAADIEEERRLFYVGVTRARESLVLSRARARVVRGKPVPRTPSRFLLDVPEELLEPVEVREERLLVESNTEHAGALLAALDALG
jgi:DNA helicase-2/ATP-dependent DNA helicase PcrA